MARKVTGVDFVKALDRAGFPDVAHNIYNMLRQKVAGDYLHTASIFDEQFHVLSAVNVPNEYHGPMTGYQISEEPLEPAEEHSQRHPSGRYLRGVKQS